MKGVLRDNGYSDNTFFEHLGTDLLDSSFAVPEYNYGVLPRGKLVYAYLLIRLMAFVDRCRG